MKKILFISAIILIVSVASCRQRNDDNNDFITVDLMKSYSSKKELIIQDFMDVEYIPLETNNDFLNQGLVQDIGEKFIIVKNRINDGDIFVYERTGKALRKINFKGQRNEHDEYSAIYNIILDEDNGEIFVNDIFLSKIFVYDLYGNFIRSFNHKEDKKSLFYTDIFIYDRDKLICYDIYNEDIAFVLISKKDGSRIKEIKIPYKNKKSLTKTLRDETTGTAFSFSPAGGQPPIIPFNGNWLLWEISSDTMFTFLPDYSLHPFIVRNPSIQTMDPEIMLLLIFHSNRYYFMQTIKNEFDFDTKRGHERTFFLYDTIEKAFFSYKAYNGDYSIKKEIYMPFLRLVNQEIAAWQPLESYQLLEDYNGGLLKDGKLKEIAKKLNEEDNPVIMLIKHKKVE